MEIHHHGKNLTAHIPPNAFAQQNASAKEVNGTDEARPSSTDKASLLEQLKSGDDVRKKLVAETKAKVLAGEYQTRAAIEAAAATIVGL